MSFYIVKVGKGATGLIASGRFSSSPYCGGVDPSNNRDYQYYCDLHFEHIVNPEKGPIITLNELTQAVPGFNWRDENISGCLSYNDAACMNHLWGEFSRKNRKFLVEQHKLGDYILEPSILENIKNSHLWREELFNNIPECEIYTYHVCKYCKNIGFSRDYRINDFNLDVLFGKKILKIICHKISEIKMNVYGRLPFAGDFYLCEAASTPEKVYLRSNGIEIWCDSIDFAAVEEINEETHNSSDDFCDFLFEKF